MNNTSIIFLIGALMFFGCSEQCKNEYLVSTLIEHQDESEIRELIEQKRIPFNDVLTSLWLILNLNDAEARKTADDAFVKISRGVFFLPSAFKMNENDYWNELAKFYILKYRTEERKEMRRAAAIYLRQIRRTGTELLANETGVPSLKELTGVELEADRL